MNDNAVPQKELDVNAQLVRLETALVALEKATNSLGSRLTFVMQENAPSDENKAEAVKSPVCELSARIAGFSDTVDSQIRYVKNLEKRLEI